jgi:hypothetical protein
LPKFQTWGTRNPSILSPYLDTNGRSDLALKFIKPERVWLANSPEYREKWVQQRLEEDPSILGLGDIVLKDKERSQPSGGRLDLLLQDAESNTRYEVEIMLGRTDESHIVRTIEYWDVERRRYPQYDHYAVIVAEDITSRFLNVIGLFNGQIPIIAVQMSALKFGDQISLIFTKVIDAVALGMPGEDEEVQAVTDRSYWEHRGTKQTVALADEMLTLIKTFAPELELKYNKFYIGLAREGQPNNFVTFRAKKNSFRAEIRLGSSPGIDQMLEAAGIEVMDYDAKWGRYRLRLTKSDIGKHSDLLLKLLKMSYGLDVEVVS